jgi:phage/plasmid-like protein (TIGR03299 family)
MAANLDRKADGTASMMYYGDVPWHKEGVKLNNPATSEEARKEAGLNWEVEKLPMYLKDSRAIPNKFAIVRNDRKKDAILGVVGSKYTIVQNKEAFTFFDSIVGEGEAMYHTAGGIDMGKKIWLMAKLPSRIKVKDEDIEKYLLLSSSHDGSGSIVARFTPIRVVCQNTLNAALNQKGNSVKIRHTKSAEASLKEAHKLLGIAVEKFAETQKIYNTFADTKLNTETFKKYLDLVFPISTEADATTTRTENTRNRISQLFDGQAIGSNTKAFRGTLYGAYNAITEYIDHERGTNTKDTNTRLEAMWFGTGNEMREKAFASALALV